MCDLEEAVFIQFRPESCFNAEQLVITSVPRDRQWFAAQLPVARRWYDRWQECRRLMTEGMTLPKELDKEQPKRRLKRKTPDFTIQTMLYGDPLIASTTALPTLPNNIVHDRQPLNMRINVLLYV